MNASRLALTLVAAALSGCSGSNLLSTGSLAPGAAPPSANDPPARAYQVGVTSARAVKCGFYFDPAKLKASFLAAEQAAGATPEGLAKIEKNYDMSNAVTAKVIAPETNYCTDAKTKYIKADLARHLAGDFSPGAPPPKEEEGEGGLFSGGGGGAPGTKAIGVYEQ